MAKKNPDWIEKALENWNGNDDDEYEFLNWSVLPKKLMVGSFIDNKYEYTYSILKVHYETIDLTWKNNFNKNQPRVIVNQYHEDMNGDIWDDGKFYLAMGKRLYKQVKQALISGWEYIEVVRRLYPDNKYDTQYFVREYKVTKQIKITDFTF